MCVCGGGGGLKVVLNPELDEFCFCVWLLGRRG